MPYSFEDINDNNILPDEIKMMIFKFKNYNDNKKANIIIRKWREKNNKYIDLRNYLRLFNLTILFNDEIVDLDILPIEINGYIYYIFRNIMLYNNITRENYKIYEKIFLKMSESFYYNYEQCIVKQYLNKSKEEIDECLLEEIEDIDLKILKKTSILIQNLGYRLILKYRILFKNSDSVIKDSIILQEYLEFINNINSEKHLSNIFCDNYINNLLRNLKSIQQVIQFDF
jgi:hypothetical protein